jgi:DNA-binding protein HU-beta
MTKQEAIELMAAEGRISFAAAERALNALFDGISQELRRGRDARFPGFGRFYLIRSSARRQRNPQTGTAFNLSARSRVRFRPSAELSDTVRNAKPLSFAQVHGAARTKKTKREK